LRSAAHVVVGGLAVAAVGTAARAETILNLGVPFNPGAPIFETQAPVTSGAVNGALYYRGRVQPSGTGVIDSFLRVQGTGNRTFEEGYNTSNGTPYDDKGGSFTHDIKVSDLNVTTIGGESYYGFLLDVAEPSSAPPDPYISLVGLKIYTSATGNRNDYNASTGTWANGGASLAYNLDGAGDARVDINYLLSGSGNGASDMFLYVKTSAFGSTSNYVYLYSAFGGTNGEPPYFADDSFEEWATALGTDGPPSGGQTDSVPLPAVAPAAFLLLGGFGLKRKRKAAL